MRGRLDPFALIVDTGEGVDGTDDGIGGGLDGIHAFDQATQGKTQIAVAAGEKADGARMAIDRCAADVEFAGDVARMRPFDEIGFDVGAVRVGADFAVALVMARSGRRFESGIQDSLAFANLRRRVLVAGVSGRFGTAGGKRVEFVHEGRPRLADQLSRIVDVREKLDGLLYG